MIVTDEYFESIIQLLTQKTGLIPRQSHKSGIRNFVESKLDSFSSDNACNQYFNQLLTDEDLFSELINQSTVNETYFFREEKQFNFLKDTFFKLWPSRNGNKIVNIWCAACSTGEEAYSIALLSKECKVKANITASDINSNVLNKCKQGYYKENSIRKGDGESYHPLLKPYINEDNIVRLDKDIINMVSTINLNLAEIDDNKYSSILPRNQNIIFIRNVFIYFSMEVRAKILKIIAENCMADDCLLFVSMNEIAPLDNNVIPSCLEKVVEGDVFFFHKKNR